MADKSIVSNSKLITLANAIRTKGGTSAQLTVDEMAQAVEDIQTYATGMELQDFLERKLANTNVVIGDVNPRFDCFLAGTNMTSLHWDATHFGNFKGICSENRNLTVAVLPNITEIGWNTTYTFSLCESLEVFDGQTSIAQFTFHRCKKLKTLIIRNSTLRALSNTSAFASDTPFASDGSGGTLYVPQALISEYQNATNWSVILGYPNNQILPIEGSIYETQYADGTPIE